MALSFHSQYNKGLLVIKKHDNAVLHVRRSSWYQQDVLSGAIVSVAICAYSCIRGSEPV